MGRHKLAWTRASIAEPPSTMLFIEDNCRALANVLSSLNKSSVRTDLKFEDFEETKFHVYEDDGGNLNISLSSPSLKCIAKKFDVAQELAGYLGRAGLKIASIEADYDLSFILDKSGLNEDKIKAIAMLRYEVMSIPLRSAFGSAQKRVDGQQMTVAVRGMEAMYILPYSDRVMVTFSLDFQDPSDVVLGKVFLQEFYDIRQKHTVQNAPTVIFGKELPSEMAKFIPEEARTKLSFISFVLLPRHFEGEKVDHAISQLLNFRTYMHYHLKCTKAYLHNRMRSKVADFLKVIDRSKIEYNC